jgi:hypothetical protein
MMVFDDLLRQAAEMSEAATVTAAMAAMAKHEWVSGWILQ